MVYAISVFVGAVWIGLEQPIPGRLKHFKSVKHIGIYRKPFRLLQVDQAV